MKMRLICILILSNFSMYLSAQDFTPVEVGTGACSDKTTIEIYPHPQHPGLYIYSEIYLKTSRVKTTGNSLSNETPRFQGPVTTFFANGNIAMEITYRDGKKLGRSNYYYKDGTLMKQVDHLLVDSGVNKLYINYRMIHFYDTLGQQLVKDGNGICRESDGEDKSWLEGEYRDGLRHGIWSGMNAKGLFYIEEYAQGTLVKRSEPTRQAALKPDNP